MISLNGLQCKIHIVPNDFPIETSGLLGWKMLKDFKGKINAQNQCLELSDMIIPFVCNEKYIILPKTRQVIHANVQNPDVQVGHVKLQNIGKGILFGNFIGTNRNGKIYAYILNTTNSVVEIDPPRVSLELCETPFISGDIFDDVKFQNLQYNEKANIFKLILDDDFDKNRAEKVFAELDPDTLKHLNEDEINHIKQLIEENPRIFSLPGEKLQATHLVTHEIKLKSDIPVRGKGYRQPPIIKEQFQLEIDDLLKKGILKESTSPYNSPTWIINKKATSGAPRWRLITDFRALNEITEGTNYPIPNQTDIIDNVASARYITCLDLTSGYYQIKIHPENSKYTAFSGPYGHYEYTRMPMGLSGSPHTFMRCIQLALAGLQGSELFVYLDDIILFSKDLFEHGQKFRKLRKRLEHANLTLNPKKCQFLQYEANFLGHSGKR